jgi:peroxiredoxin
MKYSLRFALIFILAICIQACKSRPVNSDKAPSNYSKHGIDVKKGVPEGLQVGEKAPDIQLQVGDSIASLSTILKQGPVVLMFYRGYWCPVCSRYMKTIEDSLSLLHDRGVQTYAVAPEMEKFVDETREKTQTSLSLVSDTSYTIINAFGVRFTTTSMYQAKIQVGLMKSISETNAGSNDLPIPATFLINSDRTIVYRHFDPDYHKRASIQELIEAVDRLQEGR